MDLGREGFVTAAAEKTDPGQEKQWWLPLWKRNPVCLIAEIFWAEGLVWMSPPGSPRHFLFLVGAGRIRHWRGGTAQLNKWPKL